MPIEREDLVMVCCSDIAGQVRGKGFPEPDLERHRRLGVGWTPTNVMINALGSIPATPFGAMGDLYLVPVEDGVTLEFADGSRERWMLGEIVTLDGEPWDCCLRSLARRTLGALERETGLRLIAAFEHELYHWGASERTGDSYGLSRMRGLEPFTGDLIAALRSNGLEPETALPEFGPRQLEVTVGPASGVEAADRAVKLREIARAVAAHQGSRVSFSPVVTRGSVGNGLHLHFSLGDAAGAPAMYDASAAHGLSAAAASFAAGILRHARALCALSAPSVISYERLQPNRWSAYWANLGLRDREAMLRICPVPALPGVDPAPLFNLEYRAADAAASPYLQLAAIAFAGLQGIREGLPPPAVTQTDPGKLSAGERAALGVQDLPRSLREALAALEADAAVCDWLGPVLTEAYVVHKRGEIEMLRDLPPDEVCRLYAEAY